MTYKRAIFVMLLLVPCFAAIQSLKIVSTVQPPLTTERIFFELINDFNYTLHQAYFSLPSDAYNIRVEDTYGDLAFTTTKGDVAQLLYNFSVPVGQGEQRSIIITYATKQTLRQRDSEWEFLMVFVPVSKIGVEHRLEIPPDFEINGKGSFISPEAEVRKQEGKTTIVWKSNGIPGQPLVFIARFSSPSGGINWMYFPLAVLLVAVCAVSFILFKRGIGKIKEKKMLGTLRFVHDEDRPIVELIVRNPGIKQTEIIEKLGISKASVSKRVSILIRNSLLSKEKRGRKNYLFPGKKLLE